MPASRGEINSLGINPGQFRHRITLLEPTTINDASGVSVSFAADSPAIQVWAKIETLRAEDVIKSGQDASIVNLKVTIRYNVAFTPNKRIQRYNGQVYVINGVENVLEMNRYMVLTCEGIGSNT